MATAQLVGQDCLAGMDRVRADPGSALLSEAPVAPSTTAGRLAGCFGRERLLGIEVGLAQIYTRWLARVPASVRAPLVTRHRPSIWTPPTSRSTAGPSKVSAGTTPASGPAVDLDVGGVQIDGRVPGHQRRPDRRGNPRQPAGVD